MGSHKSLSNVQVLVIDDEPDLRTLYELTLLREGYQVETAGTVQEARQALQNHRFDVVITDMRLPDGLGTDVLADLKSAQRLERCVVITAYGSAENAVESLKAGAFDYLTKPVDLKRFRTVIASAILEDGSAGSATRSTAEKLTANASVKRQAGGEFALSKLAGTSSVMLVVKERIVKIARSMAPVMVQGESGTGKELVASAVHANSHRGAGPWVAVNCSAIPENLLETEFFGAKKGAYTGATQDREGFFQAAHGGTLFLDEIGDLPLSMQAKLLRAIQERCVRPIGSNQEEPADVRIVSATHKDLAAEIAAGRFRQDLYYRLNVIDIVIPPLRERQEDLPVLCTALLERIALDSGQPAPSLSATAMHQLTRLTMPGNVRELENLLHRAFALWEGGELELDLVADECSAAITEPPTVIAMISPPEFSITEPELPDDLQQHLDQQERRILVRTLKETGFNRTVAAQRLGLSLRQIRYRIARLNIDAPNAQGEILDD
jgi:two-component system response regulator PilR (NtrC family)